MDPAQSPVLIPRVMSSPSTSVQSPNTGLLEPRDAAILQVAILQCNTAASTERHRVVWEQSAKMVGYMFKFAGVVGVVFILHSHVPWSGKTDSAPAVISLAAGSTYTVKDGDYLLALGARLTEQYTSISAEQWAQAIFDANTSVISDPNLLKPGWTLRIPGVR